MSLDAAGTVTADSAVAAAVEEHTGIGQGELAGLDALERDTSATRSLRTRLVSGVLPPLLAVGLVLVVWQLVVAAKVKPDYVLPGPAAVWSSLRDQWHQGHIVTAVRTSLGRGLIGFAASVVIGTPLGLLVARVRPARAALAPILSGLQSLPSVAWVPAGIIWFGLTPDTIYFVVLMGAVPSVANGMVAGLDQVPPLYLRVGHVLGARGLTLARTVLLPAALPAYVGGLRQGWAFAWRSLMAAELITLSPRLGIGLGQLLDTGRQLNDQSLELGVIVVILAVGVAVELLLFRPVERAVLRRRGLTAGQ